MYSIFITDFSYVRVVHTNRLQHIYVYKWNELGRPLSVVTRYIAYVKRSSFNVWLNWSFVYWIFFFSFWAIPHGIRMYERMKVHWPESHAHKKWTGFSVRFLAIIPPRKRSTTRRIEERRKKIHSETACYVHKINITRRSLDIY